MTPTSIVRARMSRRQLLQIGLGGLAWIAVPPAPASALPTGHRRPRHADSDLDTLLRDLVGHPDDPAVQPVAAQALLSGPGVRWRGAAGLADQQQRVPARPRVDYRYRIGSVTKTFTATMVLQLVGEGRLRLDDPVGRHLPGVLPGEDQLTIRQLLGMTSGLTDYLRLLFPTLRPGNSSYQEFLSATGTPIPPRDLIAMAVAAGPKFAPGRYFDYCSTNYLILGLVLERVSGHAYAEALRRRIIQPLHLRATQLPPGPVLQPPYLHGYAHFDDLEAAWRDVSHRYEHGWAAGGVVSTITDLGRFFSALTAGRLLPPDLLTAMKTPSGAPTLPGGPDGQTYGLGLMRFDSSTGRRLWGHGGDTHGYSSTVVCTADGQTPIALCTTGFPYQGTGPDDPFPAFLEAALNRPRPTAAALRG